MKENIIEKVDPDRRDDDLIVTDSASSKSSRVVETELQETESPTKPKSGLRTVVDAIVWYLRDQWFLVALACLIAIASQRQVPEKTQKRKTTIVAYLCVSVIFFVTGCTLSTQILIKNYARWKLHLFVQVQCFLLTSAIIFGIVSAAAKNPEFMDPGLLIGMIFTGCVATTISSNVVMTRQAHGNQALTVVQSTLGNLMGPFLTPALIHMYTSGGQWYTKVLPEENGDFKEIYRRVFKQLGISVFIPLLLGQLFQNAFPAFTKKVFGKYKLNKLGSLALLIIIWSTYDQAFSSGAFKDVKSSNIVFIVFVSIAIFFLLLGICFSVSMLWLPKDDVIAVCYCVPAKTPAMGVPLAHVMFIGIGTALESKIQIPLVIYQGLQIVAGSLLTILFRNWVKPEEEEKARAAEALKT